MSQNSWNAKFAAGGLRTRELMSKFSVVLFFWTEERSLLLRLGLGGTNLECDGRSFAKNKLRTPPRKLQNHWIETEGLSVGLGLSPVWKVLLAQTTRRELSPGFAHLKCLSKINTTVLRPF